jgi:PadR family transcriptional regulator PadR
VKRLTLTEQILLLAIWRLDSEAYGVKIRGLYCLHTKTDVGFGTMYNNLDQLVRNGYVISYKGEPTAIRGGKRKVYYTITDLGKDALQAAKELQNRIWGDIPENAFKRNKE